LGSRAFVWAEAPGSPRWLVRGVRIAEGGTRSRLRRAANRAWRNEHHWRELLGGPGLLPSVVGAATASSAAETDGPHHGRMVERGAASRAGGAAGATVGRERGGGVVVGYGYGAFCSPELGFSRPPGAPRRVGGRSPGASAGSGAQRRSGTPVPVGGGAAERRAAGGGRAAALGGSSLTFWPWRGLALAGVTEAPPRRG